MFVVYITRDGNDRTDVSVHETRSAAEDTRKREQERCDRQTESPCTAAIATRTAAARMAPIATSAPSAAVSPSCPGRVRMLGAVDQTASHPDRRPILCNSCHSAR
jgi:hypothetical protein